MSSRSRLRGVVARGRLRLLLSGSLALDELGGHGRTLQLLALRLMGRHLVIDPVDEGDLEKCRREEGEKKGLARGVAAAVHGAIMKDPGARINSLLPRFAPSWETWGLRLR